MNKEQLYAVIIGIGNYQDPAISKLKFTHADANEFASLLADPHRCGVPKENIKLLLDEQATCYNIKDSVSDWLFYHAQEDSTVFIFFAGHGGSEHSRRPGASEASEKYLLPWDTKLKNLYASAISCLTFNDLLDRVHVKRKVIFMDACYSGGIARTGARDLDIIENPYSNLGAGQGTIVIAASQPHQKSWELESIGHGIFTYHLIEALKGAADFDGNGEITVWEVIEYLKKTVPKSAQTHLKEVQIPYWRGEGFGDIKLTVNKRMIEELRLKQNKIYQEKRLKVLNLYQKLDQVYIDEALDLLKKSDADLLQREKDVLKFLDLLLSGDISVAQYIVCIKSLSPQEKKEKPYKQAIKSRSFTNKFCYGCGAKIVPNTRFCISCGRKIKSSE
jgi:hypothetical protein